MSRSSEWRESLGYCEETCPAVDRAFSALAEGLEAIVGEDAAPHMSRLVNICCQAVKDKGTLLLRDALVSACVDKLRVEQERDEIEQERDRLRDRVDDLESYVKSMERELAEVSA